MCVNYGVGLLLILDPMQFWIMQSVAHLRSLTLASFSHGHKAYATECTILVMSSKNRGAGRITRPEIMLS